MHPDLFTMVAAKELGCSFFELRKKPIYFRNLALMKLAIEREVEHEEREKSERRAKAKQKFSRRKR